MTTTTYFNLATRALPPMHQLLDPVEQRVVETLAAHWANKSPISVVNAMHAKHYLSPSTAHRKLKAMRLRGLLELVPDAVDTRIKYIHPTPKLLAALGKFAEVLYL